MIVEEFEDARCCKGDGNHVPEFPDCPVRVKEVKVGRIRAVEVSYAEAGKIVEAASRDDETMVVDGAQKSDVSQLRDTFQRHCTLNNWTPS